MISSKKFLLLKGLCCLGFIYAVIFHSKLHFDLSTNLSTTSEHKASSILTWTEPDFVNGQYSNPVSSKGTMFDYSQIEKIAWRLPVSDTGQLKINKETTEQLELACSYIQEGATKNDVERVQFLIQKSIPNQAGKRLARLLTKYCDYALIEREYSIELNKASGNEQLVLLQAYPDKLEALQEKVFGVFDADALFTDNNVRLRYLNQRRIINLQDLAPTERKEQLNQLQAAYQKALKGD